MKGKFLLKQFLFFVSALFMLFILSVVLLIAMNFKIINNALNDKYPVEIYNEIKENNQITARAKTMMDDGNIWLIIIDEKGDVRDSYRKPNEVPKHFEIGDVAKFTRWYLADYPVFTYVYKQGLLVLAYPKDYYAKIPSNYFKPSASFYVLKNIATIIIVDLVLLFALYFYSKRKILKEIKPIREAIKKLSKGESIEEKKCNNLSGILDELIMASNIIDEKNLSKNKWLRGITHDIRTPLTVIMAYSEELGESILGEADSIKINTIKSKAELINKILGSLNTMYLLEDKSDLKCENIDLNKLIKNIVIDYINTYDININIDLPKLDIFIPAKEILLERMIRNIIDNSIKHNDKNIEINVVLDEQSLIISDNGRITEKEVLSLNAITDEYNTKENGYGILIVKKIASIYSIDVIFEYNNGLRTKIYF